MAARRAERGQARQRRRYATTAMRLASDSDGRDAASHWRTLPERSIPWR